VVALVVLTLVVAVVGPLKLATLTALVLAVTVWPQRSQVHR
jgi:hypothetical protein